MSSPPNPDLDLQRTSNPSAFPTLQPEPMRRSSTVSSGLLLQVSHWASSIPSTNSPTTAPVPNAIPTSTSQDLSPQAVASHQTIASPSNTSDRQHSHNFSELDFMDSGLGRSLTSDLPVLGLQDELDSLQFDDLYVEEYLLSKLQDAQRRLQEVRDYKTAIDASSSPHSTDKRSRHPSVSDRLFVTSFRLPLTVEIGDDGLVKSTASSASLGLVSAFKHLWARFPIRWLGAPGQTVHSAERLPPQQRAEMKLHFKLARNRKPLGLLSYVPIFPEAKEAAAHQEFCTSVLWPLFHYIPLNLGERSYHIDMFRAYVRVNRFYAQAMIDEWKKSGIDEADAMFWVHDFQLCLVPKMLRDLLPAARIGFFLHIPFPTREVFRALAPRKELLEGMLGADLIGFHTYDYARHFLSTCERVLELRTRADAVDNKGVDVHISVYPFGIDSDTFIAATKQSAVIDLTTQLRESLVGKKIVIGVDRLDYIKGIPHKLLAIEHFLEHHPEWIGRVVFLQVTTPSTSASEEYHAFRAEILVMVGRINGRFATIEDTPIHYRELNLTLEELCALYSGADVAMITSIRDGMNLVSYEYIVCQKECNGVLILSEFAGAAKNLPGALLVNPWDLEDVSDAILQSLEMGELERELRHQKLYRHVVKHTAAAWGVSFIDDLVKYSSQRSEKGKFLVEMPMQQIRESYCQAKGKRVFFLDYDGTLRKYECQPELADPTRGLLRSLKKLTASDQNVVFIVTGRQKATMEAWFSGTGVGFAVEHGFSIRWPDHLRDRFGGRRRPAFTNGAVSRMKTERGNKERDGDEEAESGGDDDTRNGWDDLLKADDLIAMRNTLQVVGSFLKRCVEGAPLSFVSKKESAFSWHFRHAGPKFAQMRAQEARQSLEERLAGSPMEVLMGQQILYVRPRGVHKGSAVSEVMKRLCAEGETLTWLFSVGDDCTDEDMFHELHRFAKESDAVVNTCTVGRKTTSAKYYASGVDDILDLLDALAES